MTPPTTNQATADQARTLPAFFDMSVPEDVIDENGHMNISAYFQYGSWAPWQLLGTLGMNEDYIEGRGLSFFTVGHHISYLEELRLGERFTVRAGIAGRSGRAVHLTALILDEERDRLACVLEAMYVHISMETRRAAPIPEELVAAIEASAAAHPWVAEISTGLTLRR
ncbi:hypothetical protein BH11ACT8_BH11ACT8_22810 [soil metagenome]